MNRIARRSLKLLGRVVLALLLWVGLQATVLAFPSPWFDGSVREDNVSLYFSGARQGEMERLVQDVVRRVRAAEVYRDDVHLRVFVCAEQSLFNLFARLSLVPISVPGFNLSLLGNSFVSVPRLEQRQRSGHGSVTHSALSGNLAHGIAHELIHDFVRKRIGYRKRLPDWKSEGYAEYAAARVAIAADPDAALARRIEILQTAVTDPRARDYYESALIIEFLATELGYGFDEIMADSVTREDARRQMAAWYEALR